MPAGPSGTEAWTPDLQAERRGSGPLTPSGAGRMMGLPPGWAGNLQRAAQLRTPGDAVVPQNAAMLGRALLAAGPVCPATVTRTGVHDGL